MIFRFAALLLLWLAGIGPLHAQTVATQPLLPQQTGATGWPPNAVATMIAFGTAGLPGGGTFNLPAAPGRLTFLCGLAVNGLGATALSSGTVNVVNVLSGMSYTYQYPAGVTNLATPINVTYTPCLPATASNVSPSVQIGITATGNTLTNVVVWGYQIPSP